MRSLDFGLPTNPFLEFRALVLVCIDKGIESETRVSERWRDLWISPPNKVSMTLEKWLVISQNPAWSPTHFYLKGSDPEW